MRFSCSAAFFLFSVFIMKTKYISTLMFVVLLAIGANAQNTRINDDNQIGWWAFFSTLKLNDRWGIHAEYQWRRENFVADWQQSLLRVGLNYQASKRLQLRLGYAWIETFQYGDFPINAMGRDFTEHRAFQMATLTDKLGRLDLSHRFMLEQRWIGRYTNPEKEREDEYFFVNRLRYMLRLQCPLQGATLEDKEFYAAAYNEVFVGFGKNVNENVFDQNRIGLLVGYRLNKTLRVEGGFFHQTLQLPREVLLPGSTNGQNVFQYNSGFIVNLFLNLEAGKSSTQESGK
jgi:hypothetical protein